MTEDWVGEERRGPAEYALSNQMRTLHSDISEVKGTLSRLTDAITKLALVEDRQTRSAEAVEKAFIAIEKVSDRVSLIENQLPSLVSQSGRVNRWADKIVWALFSGLAVYVLNSTGVL